MREFRKTKRLTRWQKFWRFIFPWIFDDDSSYQQDHKWGHSDRMRARRRKTRFHK